MAEEPREQILLIEDAGPRVTITLIPRRIQLYTITDQELDSLASISNSVSLAFFSLTTGGAVSFLVTLLTIAMTGTILAVFVALFTVSLVFVVFFAIRAWLDWRAAGRRANLIRSERRSL